MRTSWVWALFLILPVLSGCLGPDDGPTPLLAEAAASPVYSHDPDAVLTTLELPSFDDHVIPVSVYRPAYASAEEPVPMLLHSHGFTGSRATEPDAFADHIRAGFGVVSFDGRGHGDSRDDSVVRFMNPDYEVRDTMRVLDEMATWDWVLLDGPGDARVGGIGYSYGGAMQLMAAVFDDRLDAITPEITWSDITESLAPGGVPKTGWIDFFYLTGTALGLVTFSQEFNEGFVWLSATNRFPEGQSDVAPDLRPAFDRASPANYPGRITVPTLLVQGMKDTLFPLNQAIANLEGIQPTGAPVQLATHLTGHILNAARYADDAPAFIGAQSAPGGRPCGAQSDLELAWHQRHLMGLDVDTGPAVCLALETGDRIVADQWPLPGTRPVTVDVAGPFPLVAAPAGTGVFVDLLTVDQETVIAGIPTLNVTVSTAGIDGILHFGLRILDPDRGGYLETYVDDQVTPLRIAGAGTGQTYSLDLGGVATRLAPGQTLSLAVTATEPQYFTSGSRVPEGVVVEGIQVSLPVVDDIPILGPQS